MTSTLQLFRTLTVATAALLYAASAAPQPAAQPQVHNHGDPPASLRPQNTVAASSVMEQIAALDKRIQMLATDMRMLSGEMKVDVMASLLSSMLDRQSLMESEMKTIREGMMRRMMERREPPSASLEQEPEEMCAPSN
jgi:hypothetical protein